MAILGSLSALFIPESIPTLILCFSIGGMAEMVLTAKALGQNVALVAAFQAIRGIVVNVIAGPVWARLSVLPKYSTHPE